MNPFPAPFGSADTADFEAFIEQSTAAKSGEARDDLARFLRANPGHTHKDWKHGTKPRLCETEVDPNAPRNGIERSSYVRLQASRYLAHTLPLDVRRQAARDPALIWNPLTRRYRLRTAEDDAGECASVDQYVASREGPASPPAPAPASLDNAEIGRGH